MRSSNDQFSCDTRNLKSAQSQFPVVPQTEMICQTGGSVQVRIAEEREKAHAQIRTMLDEQRRMNDYRWMQWKSSSSRTPRITCRTRSQSSSGRITATATGISWSSSARSYEASRIAKIPEFCLWWVHSEEVHRRSEDYYGFIWKTSRTTEWSKFHEWFQGFYGCWIDLQKSTRYQSTWIIP